MSRPQTRAAEFAAQRNLSIANASMKFKQLWDRGFLLRRESAAGLAASNLSTALSGNFFESR